MGETLEDIETVIGDFRLSGSSREVINPHHYLLWGTNLSPSSTGNIGVIGNQACTSPFLYSTIFMYLTTYYSTYLRPSAQESDVSTFLIAGKIIRETITSPQSIIQAFYEISGRRDIVIQDVIWSSRYR